MGDLFVLLAQAEEEFALAGDIERLGRGKPEGDGPRAGCVADRHGSLEQVRRDVARSVNDADYEDAVSVFW